MWLIKRYTSDECARVHNNPWSKRQARSQTIQIFFKSIPLYFVWVRLCNEVQRILFSDKVAEIWSRNNYALYQIHSESRYILLYGCKTLSLTFIEKHRLKVFEKRSLRRIFGLKREELQGEWRGSFMSSTLQQIFGWLNQEERDGRNM